MVIKNSSIILNILFYRICPAAGFARGTKQLLINIAFCNSFSEKKAMGSL